MFKYALVKKPAKSIEKGITTADLGKPIYELACIQHEKYRDTLIKCGLELIVLEPSEKFPDSVFVEDTVVAAGDTLIVSNPGAISRRKEPEYIIKPLEGYFRHIERISGSARIEGGDVMLTENIFYVGITGRTNLEGAEQFAKAVSNAGFDCRFVKLNEFLHLKTGVSYVGDNRILVTGELVENSLFKDFEKIIIPENESYSANSIRVNEYIIIPEGFKTVKNKLEKFGYKTISVNTSEFRKIDGGLSCLSVRF